MIVKELKKILAICPDDLEVIGKFPDASSGFNIFTYFRGNFLT